MPEGDGLVTTLRDALLARLAEIREVTDAATPGPWEAWQDPGVNAMNIRLGLPPLDHDPEPSPYWGVQIEGAVYPDGAVAAFGTEADHGKEDARFVVLSRSVLGPLVEGLAEEVGRHDCTDTALPPNTISRCCDECGEYVEPGSYCNFVMRWADRLGVTVEEGT